MGSAAVAMAAARGATVIGTSSMSKHAYLRTLGALPTTYGQGLADRVRELAPAGVDAVLDMAASGSLPDLVAIAGDADRVVTVADAARAGELGVRHPLRGERRHGARRGRGTGQSGQVHAPPRRNLLVGQDRRSAPGGRTRPHPGEDSDHPVAATAARTRLPSPLATSGQDGAGAAGLPPVACRVGGVLTAAARSAPDDIGD